MRRCEFEDRPAPSFTGRVSSRAAADAWTEAKRRIRAENEAVYALVAGSRVIGADGSGVYVMLTAPCRVKRSILLRGGAATDLVREVWESLAWQGARVWFKADPDERPLSLEEVWRKHSRVQLMYLKPRGAATGRSKGDRDVA